MNRLDRRMRLMRGRARTAFDPAQRRVEALPRERAARLVRGALRTGRPVVVRHARWAAERWWLEDVSVDLRTSDLPVEARVLDLAELARTQELGPRLPDAVGRALGVAASSKALFATSREAFRLQTGLVLHKARSRKRRRALLCVNADLLGYERLQDLCDAVTAARSEMTPGTSPLLVVACRIGGQSLELDHAMSFLLPDPSRREAVFLLAELLGADDPDHLEAIVDAVGVVPAFLEAVARAGGPTDPAGVRQALGPLLRELAEAIDIVGARGPAEQRIEALAGGAQPLDPEQDWPLLRAGLVTVDRSRGEARTRLRSPLVAEIAGF